MHVGTVIGRFTVRDPPQTQHRHNMVDTQRTAVLHVGAQQFDKRFVSTCRDDVRIHRRQPPVLPQRTENIRRRANRGFQAVQLAVAPGFRPAFSHTNRQVAIQPDRHRKALAGFPAVSELGIRQPLKPQVEVHVITMRFAELFDLWRVHRLESLWPHRPAPAQGVFFHLMRMQGVKGRLPVQAIAFLSHKLAKCRHLLIIARREAFPRHT